MRAYTRVLRQMGVRDPWALELAPLAPGALAAAFGRMVVAAPLAAIGAVMGWLPYRLAGEVAKRVTRDEDLLSTVKLLAGALFLALAWGLEATVAGFAWGPLWAAPTFAAGIATGYVALRFEELRREAAEAWRLVMLRAFHHQTTRAPRRTPPRARRRRSRAACATRTPTPATRRSRRLGSLRAQVVEDQAGHGPRRRAAAGGRLRSGPREHDLDIC